MNRRGFLGSIMLLGAAPALRKADWLVPVDWLPPADESKALAGRGGWIQIMQHNVRNETEHLAEWSLQRGETFLMRSMINCGGVHHWWAPPGEEIIVPFASVRYTAPPGIDMRVIYRDMDTGKMMCAGTGGLSVALQA